MWHKPTDYQCVTINSVMSVLASLVYSVPQGSILGSIIFSIYTLPLGAIIRHYNVQYHIYFDDTQLCVSFKAADYSNEFLKLCSCWTDIRTWMITNDLKLNDGKNWILDFQIVSPTKLFIKYYTWYLWFAYYALFYSQNSRCYIWSMDKQIAHISKCFVFCI